MDIKLFHGIFYQNKKVINRFPTSRTNRIRYSTDRWLETDNYWNKKVAEEFQNNHNGAFQGNFDKPICDKTFAVGIGHYPSMILSASDMNL